ncbi:MAG TPA: hypothetical protein VF948_07900 [Methylomirabilota bacterium]
MTNRTAELGPIPEEAGGAQRHEQHRGSQAKMLGPDAKGGPAIPGGDGQWRDRLEGTPGDFERFPGHRDPLRKTPDNWTK